MGVRAVYGWLAACFADVGLERGKDVLVVIACCRRCGHRHRSRCMYGLGEWQNVLRTATHCWLSGEWSINMLRLGWHYVSRAS